MSNQPSNMFHTLEDALNTLERYKQDPLYPKAKEALESNDPYKISAFNFYENTTVSHTQTSYAIKGLMDVYMRQNTNIDVKKHHEKLMNLKKNQEL